jgi:pyruvate dehydrogenase E1 component
MKADWELAREWIDSADALSAALGPEAALVLGEIDHRIARTPSRNTHPATTPPNDDPFSVIEKYVRWNAAMMVCHANHDVDGIGGHLSTFASSSTLFSVAWDHFLKGRTHESGGDHVFFQGHASPGVYARAFLERRLTPEQLAAFRQESKGGLSSYPHPRLMPEFWEFPTVSMGLSASAAVQQALVDRYFLLRGLKDTSDQRVWAFLGDGECDEPETLAMIRTAARAALSNLTFVVSCNLQRLDGPANGSGNTLDELARLFRGAGWDVIIAWWGERFEKLFELRPELAWHLASITDGDLQRITATASAEAVRTELLGTHADLVADWSDDDVAALALDAGGASRAVLFGAYQAATASDRPTVVLARTVKGHLFPHAGRNAAHQVKKLTAPDVLAFAQNLELTLEQSEIDEIQAGGFPFLSLPPHLQAVLDARTETHGSVPTRRAAEPSSITPNLSELQAPSAKPASTTAVLTRALKLTMEHEHLVPIVADEGRTFGFDPLYSAMGVFAPDVRYQAVDHALPLRYREAPDGRFLQAGISEAAALALFQVVGTAHATQSTPTIPWYTFYSMFGLQRVGDQIWQCIDARARGLLVGATAGRTTLHGEGLQHQDGHSLAWAMNVPHLNAFDCAFAYELGDVLEWQFSRWAQNHEELCYLTAYNEAWDHPARPESCAPGDVVRGGYVFAEPIVDGPRVALLFSGPMHAAAKRARDELAELGVAASLVALTSVKQLWLDALDAERRSIASSAPVESHVQRLLADRGPAVVVSDWSRTLASSLAPHISQRMHLLGTDGLGRSDSREALRAHFNVEAADVTAMALWSLRSSELPARAHTRLAELAPRFAPPGAHRADA